MRELINRSRENWALIRSNQSQNTRLAVFVHGFRGNYLSTWGAIPELLKLHADSDNDFAAWDYLFIGYSTRDVSTYLDIASLIGTNVKHALRGQAPYSRKYDKVALFGHSVGTLGIRQFLCAKSVHEAPISKVLHGVMLFGAPLNGSPLAGMGALFYPVADALKPMSPQLRMLREWSKSAYGTEAWPSVRVVLGQGDWVVGYQFQDLIEWPGDERPDMTVVDHSQLVKSTAWENCSVVDFIREGLR